MSAFARPAARPAFTRTIGARNALISQWSGLVPHVVRELRNLLMVRLYRAECLSAGHVALVRAAELWSEDDGTPFPCYAFAAIRNRVLSEVGRLCRLSRRERCCDPRSLAGPNRTSAGPDRFDPAPVRAAVAQLPPRERRAIVLRFGLDGGGGRMHKEVAAALGVSKSRAHQLADRAMGLLSVALRRQGVRSCR